MDVVYNHMASTSDNAFNKIMPKYYFLTNDAGYYYDETGCNNTIATGRKMAKNFIVQSVKLWAQQYGIKGFRFDLMESFFGSMKREMFYGHESEYKDFGSFRKAVDAYISWYNSERLRYFKGQRKWMSPLA